MIIGALISLIGLIALTIITWLPAADTAPLPEGFATSIDSLFDFIYSWNYVFPVSELITLLGYAVLFWLAWLAVNAVFYIIALIRGN